MRRYRVYAVCRDWPVRETFWCVGYLLDAPWHVPQRVQPLITVNTWPEAIRRVNHLIARDRERPI